MRISTMKVAIVGSRIGGLTCAIACAQADLEVEILAKAPKLLPVRANLGTDTSMY